MASARTAKNLGINAMVSVQRNKQCENYIKKCSGDSVVDGGAMSGNKERGAYFTKKQDKLTQQMSPNHL